MLAPFFHFFLIQKPQTVEVRCHCRLPEVDNDSALIPKRFRSWIRCNQCKNRYHKHCENVQETAKHTGSPYICSKCTGPLEGDPLEGGPLEDDLTEEGPTEDGPTEDGPTEDGPTEDVPTEYVPNEDGPTEDGPLDLRMK